MKGKKRKLAARFCKGCGKLGAKSIHRLGGVWHWDCLDRETKRLGLEDSRRYELALHPGEGQRQIVIGFDKAFK